MTPFKFRKLSCCIIWINYYNTVSLSKHIANKRSRKTDIRLTSTYFQIPRSNGMHWHPPTFKFLVLMVCMLLSIYYSPKCVVFIITNDTQIFCILQYQKKIHDINTETETIFESINCYFCAKFFGWNFKIVTSIFFFESFSDETFCI